MPATAQLPASETNALAYFDLFHLFTRAQLVWKHFKQRPETNILSSYANLNWMMIIRLLQLIAFPEILLYVL